MYKLELQIPLRPSGKLTWNQGPVSERVHGPNVGRPVCMAQPTRKGEKSVLQLKNLPPLYEGSECDRKDTDHTDTQLDDVPETRSQEFLRVKAVCAQEEDEVGERQVEVDVLEAEKRSENDSAEKLVVARQNNG